MVPKKTSGLSELSLRWSGEGSSVILSGKKTKKTKNTPFLIPLPYFVVKSLVWQV